MNLPLKHINFKSNIIPLRIFPFILILSLFLYGISQNLTNPEGREKYWSLPIAISILYQGHVHDYAGWRTTSIPFQGMQFNKESISQAINRPVDKTQGNFYKILSAKGGVDYIIAAFYIFGPKPISLYYLWFLILISSTSLYLLTFRTNKWALGYLSLILLSIFSATEPLSSIFNSETKSMGLSIYDPRFYDVLAIISVFHILFSAIFLKTKEYINNLFPMLLQMSIFIFLLHCRTTLEWEVVAIFGTLSVIFLLNIKNPIKYRLSRVSTLSTVVLFLIFLSLFSIYKRTTYNSEYYKSTSGVNEGRSIWHNVLMGSKPSSKINDAYVVSEVTSYARQSHKCSPLVEKMNPEILLNTLGGWGKQNWKVYDRCARSLFIHDFLSRKIGTIKYYIYTKPLNSFYSLFLYDNTRIISFYYLIPFLIISVFCLKEIYQHRKMLYIISIIIFLTSMLPSTLFYLSPFNLDGMRIMRFLIIYLSIIILIYSLLNVINVLLSNRLGKANPLKIY